MEWIKKNSNEDRSDINIHIRGGMRGETYISFGPGIVERILTNQLEMSNNQNREYLTVGCDKDRIYFKRVSRLEGYTLNYFDSKHSSSVTVYIPKYAKMKKAIGCDLQYDEKEKLYFVEVDI